MTPDPTGPVAPDLDRPLTADVRSRRGREIMRAMQESFFTRSEWLGVDFLDLGLPLDAARGASAAFYDALYAELRHRHETVETFPPGWRATKQDTAACLAALIDPHDRVLSFGAGIGFVEWMLIDRYGVRELLLWEVASQAREFLPQLRHRYLPGDVWPEPVDDARFDVVCVVQVLYAFDHAHAVEVLTGLRDLLARQGRMVIVEGSAVPAQNGFPDDGAVRHDDPRDPGGGLTGSWRASAQAGCSAPRGHQGWGWIRDNACIHAICAEAGLTARSFPAAGQSVTVATVAPPDAAAASGPTRGAGRG